MSEADLEAGLGRLLQIAFESDVNPEGSWVFRNGDSEPDWEVQITRLAKQH